MLVKFISWNVNGLRALLTKPEANWLLDSDAQIIALQETKAEPAQIPEDIRERPGWYSYWDSSTVKKGYSGVCVFTRMKPQKVTAQLPNIQYQGEGRLLHLEYEEFHFFNGYFPNGGAAVLDENGEPTGKFKRVPYKLGFLNDFLELAIECEKTRPVVFCGDFNISHHDIDVAKPVEYSSISGFLPEERAFMDKLTQSGFVDAFRLLHPNERDRYTWWSYQNRARQKNMGWRIDYFFVSRSLADKVRQAEILSDIKGSDHCPVELALEI